LSKFSNNCQSLISSGARSLARSFIFVLLPLRLPTSVQGLDIRLLPGLSWFWGIVKVMEQLSKLWNNCQSFVSSTPCVNSRPLFFSLFLVRYPTHMLGFGFIRMRCSLDSSSCQSYGTHPDFFFEVYF
jgi:hypothetical protein